MRRTVVVELPFCFTDDDDLWASDPSKYRRRDNTVKDRLENDKRCMYALLDILVQVYGSDRNRFLDGTWLLEQGTPQKVRDSTSAYFDKFDTTAGVNTWLADNVEEGELDDKLDLDILWRDFGRETGSKVLKKVFILKVEKKLGKRIELAAGVYTPGVYKSGNFLGLQGFKRKEVLMPSSLDEQFRENNDGMEELVSSFQSMTRKTARTEE